MSRISGLVFLFVMISCGGQDSSDKKDGIADSDHRIFVTSLTFTGNMGGVDAADTLCSQAANSAGLERTYKAILSTSAIDAEVRLNITGGIYMFTDSSTPVLIAASGIDLWGTDSDPLKNAINRTEQYSIVNDNIWTGTNSEGGTFSTQNCNNWGREISIPNWFD